MDCPIRICPYCIKEGKKSTLNVPQKLDPGMGHFIKEFFDEEGGYHNHDSKKKCFNYECSNGHEFTVFVFDKCKNSGCLFGYEDEIEIKTKKELEEENLKLFKELKKTF